MKINEMKAAFTQEVKNYYNGDTNLDRFISDTLDAFDGEIKLKSRSRDYRGDCALFQLEDGTVQFNGEGIGYHGVYVYNIELTHAIKH